MNLRELGRLYAFTRILRKKKQIDLGELLFLTQSSMQTWRNTSWRSKRNFVSQPSNIPIHFLRLKKVTQMSDWVNLNQRSDRDMDPSPQNQAWTHSASIRQWNKEGSRWWVPHQLLFNKITTEQSLIFHKKVPRVKTNVRTRYNRLADLKTYLEQPSMIITRPQVASSQSTYNAPNSIEISPPRPNRCHNNFQKARSRYTHQNPWSSSMSKAFQSICLQKIEVTKWVGSTSRQRKQRKKPVTAQIRMV